MPRICEVGGEKGLLLPLFPETEHLWPRWLQSILYLLGLFWLFMAVAIIADVFMGAIEKVTSKRKRIYNKLLQKEVTVLVWNPSVANLTLMALGSSAPEILLNVKEIFEKKFHIGALGAMTIVGSAAFNLLIILAVCVAAIPEGEKRFIKDLGVYSVTATFSIFAYIWLLIIVVAPPSKDVVEVHEGVITFMFFPILVFIAYLADIGVLPGTHKDDKGSIVRTDYSQDEVRDMEKQIRLKYPERQLTDKQVAALINFEFPTGTPYSRAFHRVNATRAMFRGKTIMQDTLYHQGRRCSVDNGGSGRGRKDSLYTGTDAAVVAFEENDIIVMETDGQVSIKVNRKGDMDSKVKVTYTTRDGSAKREQDYDWTEGILSFEPQVKQLSFDVGIHHSKEHEETEEFYCDLTIVNEEGGPAARLGTNKTIRIRIIDESQPGKLAFDKEELHIERPHEEPEAHTVAVRRRRGNDGPVSCAYVTEADTATEGADFEQTEGRLEFPDGEVDRTIDITVLPKAGHEKAEVFRLVLKDAEGGATFDDTTDGGRDCAILTVFLHPSGKKGGSDVYAIMGMDKDKMSLGYSKWTDQFSTAMRCNGDEEGEAQATTLDWTIHFIALPWKLLFALVPPVDYAGGWVCFFVALGAIGFVTVLIGDLASMLGCALKISEFATAITFVALGTSLPDTFASKTAAVHDPTADASIGNVTGSNSVNVFLGLGLPWMIGAIYWKIQGAEPGDEWYKKYPDLAKDYPDGAFIVKSEGLGLSVGVFTGCSVTCLLVLALRRKFLGAELGGPKKPKIITSAFLVLLWLVYIVISIMNAPKEEES